MGEDNAKKLLEKWRSGNIQCVRSRMPVVRQRTDKVEAVKSTGDAGRRNEEGEFGVSVAQAGNCDQGVRRCLPRTYFQMAMDQRICCNVGARQFRRVERVLGTCLPASAALV